MSAPTQAVAPLPPPSLAERQHIRCVREVWIENGRRKARFTDKRKTNYARLVAAVKIGRPLRTEEVVHHENGDSADDSLGNLAVLPSTAHHTRLHAELRRAQRTECVRGHSYAEHGVIHADGVRRCRECHRQRMARVAALNVASGLTAKGHRRKSA